MSPRVADWGFSTSAAGELLVGGASAEMLAREHGTPLHLIDEAGLERRARTIAAAFAEAYPGQCRVHFAMKCNDTPGVAAIVIGAGLAVEVGTHYEWWLARRLGVSPADIVVNGPLKGALLDLACREGAGYVVLDGLDEIESAADIAARLGTAPRVLLRVNPDCVPRGMNRATATGSRRRSMFGFDLASGETDEAFVRLARGGPLKYAGLHCHVGSGIRHPGDYRLPVERLLACAVRATEAGLRTDVLDIGGGFGVATSRELTTREYLTYHALGRLPVPENAAAFPPVEKFAAVIAETIVGACSRYRLPLPVLLLEPGRAVASGAGVLLLTVGRIKHRQGVGTWAIADGGAGTVAFPLFYELHEILHCRTPQAAPTHRYDIVGGACFSADWIYRGKHLPELRVGDVLAVCDAGAYFTVQESNFGFPHPAIHGVRDGKSRVLRRRESFQDMVGRDVTDLTAAEPPLAAGTPQAVPATSTPLDCGCKSGLRFRRLTPADTAEAVAIFAHGFDGHELYSKALGLDRATFGEYFATLLPLAFADERGIVCGTEHEGRLVAVLIGARPGFPTLRNGLRHIVAFARVAGWKAVIRYLRFDYGLERFMRRPRDQRNGEFRGLWLAACAGVTGRCAGRFLVRAACDYARRIGYPLQAALVDGADRRLVSFYQRLGFQITPSTVFLGGRAVRMERRS